MRSEAFSVSQALCTTARKAKEAKVGVGMERTILEGSSSLQAKWIALIILPYTVDSAYGRRQIYVEPGCVGPDKAWAQSAVESWC